MNDIEFIDWFFNKRYLFFGEQIKYKFNNQIIKSLIDLISEVEYSIGSNNNIKEYIISFTIIVFTISGSLLISNISYDITFDGNTYHKAAIGELKNGWNPVYQSIEDFNDSDLLKREKFIV